jgi:antitoxin ParD1/3/4
LVWPQIEAIDMSKNTSIALGQHFQKFVREQVTQGRYGSTSEVIRAGLRLLEEHNAKLTALRNAIQEGIDSGPAEMFDFDEFISAKENGQRRA